MTGVSRTTNFDINEPGNDQQLPGLTWVMITDPNQSRDRDTMRNVRIHVMNDYLSKEQRNPHSTDARVRHSGRRGHVSDISSPEARKKSKQTETRSRSPRFRDSVIEMAPPPERKHTRIEANMSDDAKAAVLAPYVASKMQLGGIGSKCDVFHATPRLKVENVDVKMLKHNCMSISLKPPDCSCSINIYMQVQLILEVRPCARNGHLCYSLPGQLS